MMTNVVHQTSPAVLGQSERGSKRTGLNHIDGVIHVKELYELIGFLDYRI